MDPDFALNLVLALAALLGVGIALARLAPRLERAFGRGGGRWRDLAPRYATPLPMPERARPRQHVMIGPVLYRNSMTVGADAAGLFLQPGPPVSLFLKERLLIPWSEVAKTEPATLFWGKATTLIVGAPALATVTLQAATFEACVRPWLAARTTESCA
jgi:hypothetical protein